MCRIRSATANSGSTRLRPCAAARLVEDAAFTPEWVRRELVPLLSDPEQLAAAAAAAEGEGTRFGTENVIAHLDRARDAHPEDHS